MKSKSTEELNERIKRTHYDCGCCRNWTRISELQTNDRLKSVLEKVKGIRKEDPNKVPPFPKVQYNHLDILGFNVAVEEITTLLQAEINKGV